MIYFAYGSNMCTDRLKSRVSSCKFYGTAVLKRCKLKFHKRSKDGSGKCNITKTGNKQDEVMGVLFELNDCDKRGLDIVEGLGHGYHEVSVKIVAPHGNLITAFMYIADADAIDESLQPYTWYKDLVIRGARQHGFPKYYIKNLIAVRSKANNEK